MKLELKEKANLGVVRLYLEKQGEDIVLNAIESDDDVWELLTISKRGINLSTDIPSRLGFDIDVEGRLKIVSVFE